MGRAEDPETGHVDGIADGEAEIDDDDDDELLELVDEGFEDEREISAVNDALDTINQALDKLEEQNDQLNEQLRSILAAQQRIRYGLEAVQMHVVQFFNVHASYCLCIQSEMLEFRGSFSKNNKLFDELTEKAGVSVSEDGNEKITSLDDSGSSNGRTTSRKLFSLMLDCLSTLNVKNTELSMHRLFHLCHSSSARKRSICKEFVDSCLKTKNSLSDWVQVITDFSESSVDHRDVLLEVLPRNLFRASPMVNEPCELSKNLASLIRAVFRYEINITSSFKVSLDLLLNVCWKGMFCCEVVGACCETILKLLNGVRKQSMLHEMKSRPLMIMFTRHIRMTECRRNCLTEMVQLVADLFASDNDLCQNFIDRGALDVLSVIMNEELSHLYHYACFALANVFACTSEQIQCAINQGLLSSTIERLLDEDALVAREAAIALCSFVGGANCRQALQAIRKGLIPSLVLILENDDETLVYDALASLSNLMNISHDLSIQNEIKDDMLATGMTEIVLELTAHACPEISKVAGILAEQLGKLELEIDEYDDAVLETSF